LACDINLAHSSRNVEELLALTLIFHSVFHTVYSVLFCPEIMEVLPTYPTPFLDQDCLQTASSGRLQNTSVTFKLIPERASLLAVSANCAVTCLVRSDDF